MPYRFEDNRRLSDHWQALGTCKRNLEAGVPGQGAQLHTALYQPADRGHNFKDHAWELGLHEPLEGRQDNLRPDGNGGHS